MKLTLSDVLTRLNQAREQITYLPSLKDDFSRQAAHLSEMLRTLWPAAPLYVCFVDDHGSARDKAGKERPEWLKPLRAAAGTDAPLPAELNLAGHRLVWETIGEDRGGFGVAAPDELPAANETALRTLLQTTAALTAAHLDAEALREELAANLVLADVAEVASPVAHEFNNFLNALLLHVAVLELKLAPEQRQGLAEIRQLGKGMATLVQQWQNYRRRSPDGLTADLNRAARDAAAAVGEAVRLELRPGALPVPGTPADLKRLCTFLSRNAVAVTAPGETITVRTAKEDGKVLLRVEDGGPALAPERLADYFDAYPVRREGTSGLELAACKTLVRRLQGKIGAENGTDRGVTVTVQLPAGGGRAV